MATYSQSGEDKIIDFFLGIAGLGNATYIDVGSSHPILGNNTYLLYRRGLRGICVDPTPGLEQLYRTYRRRDVFMPYALVPGAEEATTMHIFEESTLNSASAEHAELYSAFGFKKGSTRRVPAINLERLCALHGIESPDVLCLDVEGLDLAVLEGADLSRIRPKLICVEAVRYLSDKTPVVEPRFAEVLQAKGYVKYADTFINQIFADEAHHARLKLL
jgi:FkbM family methyltransferase